jgi:hypothetical protein
MNRRSLIFLAAFCHPFVTRFSSSRPAAKILNCDFYSEIGMKKQKQPQTKTTKNTPRLQQKN